jgi:hypothetical protein
MSSLNKKALLTNKLIKTLGKKDQPYRIYYTDIIGFVTRIMLSGKICCQLWFVTGLSFGTGSYFVTA